MNTYAAISCLVSVVILSQTTLSQQQGTAEENNIIISSKTETYEFIKGNADHPVLVSAQLSTTYKCNGFRTSVPIVELYNDYTSIDIASVNVNGHSVKKFAPKHSYYPVNDVFYSDARICYFDLPLEKRSTESQVTVIKTINDPRYFTSIYFDEDYYFGHKTVTVKVPIWMKLEIREYNFLAVGIIKQTEQKEGFVIYKYTMQNRPARKFLEYAPGDSYIYPHLLILSQSAQPGGTATITYFQSLQDQYDWCYSLVRQINNNSSLFSMHVQELVKEKSSDTEKIQAIFQWVQANIRYIAFENGIAAFKPENAQEVYRKKYGDCKGMANLTKEMLRILGYDARFCWLGTNHIAYDHSTPSLAVDNHLICAVLVNGKFIFLDATQKYIGLGEYAERIQGRQVLIENGDSCILENVPTALPAQNTVTVKRFLKVDSVSISGTVTCNAKGESKEYLHFGINSIASNKREITLQQFLSGDNVNNKIQDLVVTGLENWNKPISIKYTIQQNGAVTTFGDEKYLNLGLKNDFASFRIDTLREEDVWLPYKFHFIDTTELTIPDGFTVAQFPKPVYIKNDAYQFNLHYSYTGKKIVYTKEIMMTSAIIKKQQFETWNAVMMTLNNFYKEQIMLRRS